jgi:hypothetical protein
VSLDCSGGTGECGQEMLSDCLGNSCVLACAALRYMMRTAEAAAAF